MKTPFFLQLTMFRSVIVYSGLIGLVMAHENHGGSCESSSEVRIMAEYRPGTVDLDGRGDDWKDVDGFEFPLRPALDPDEENQYRGGKMTVKALHDGNDVFFMLKVDGDYAYRKGINNKCPSVALMFQVGENASYHNMGGCKETKDTCNKKSCRGYEVDIMHFSIGNAIPGRLYGRNPINNRDGNGGDRFGHLVDLYAWNPHCQYLNGMGPSEGGGGGGGGGDDDDDDDDDDDNDDDDKDNNDDNDGDGKGGRGKRVGRGREGHRRNSHARGFSGNDSSVQNNWKGAWWHDSLTVHSGFVEEDSPYVAAGQKGTYYFEFSRPLRTMDRLQQDAQFTIGQSSMVSVAFWFPVEGNPWSGSEHYSINCDWVPLDIISPSTTSSMKLTSSRPWDAASAFSLLVSVVSFSLSVFVGYWVSRSKAIRYTPIDDL